MKTTIKKKKKCKFDKHGTCYASVCLFSYKCGARDTRGFPKYVVAYKGINLPNGLK